MDDTYRYALGLITFEDILSHMKTNVLLIAFLLFFTSVINAQTPSWVNTVGSSGIELSGCFDKDPSGNVYMCGKFSGTVDVDPSAATYNLTSNGMFDAFIIKYSPTGQLLWAFNIGGADVDEITGVKINNAGEILITGYYRGANVDFDPGSGYYPMDAPGLGGTDVGFGGDIFLAKYTSSGNFIWAFSIIGSYSHDKPEDLAVDASDNIYVVGSVNGTSTYPIDADPGPGVYDIGGVGHAFVAKYTTAANFVWAFNYGSYGLNTGAQKIAMDPTDTTFVIAGFFRGTNIDFDPGPGVFNLTSNGVEDGILAKYSVNKTFVWAMEYGGPSVDYTTDVKIDSNHSVYATGMFNGTNVDFNPSVAVAAISSAGGRDGFMAKYTKNGAYLWAYPMGSTLDDYGESISQWGNRLIVTGSFQNTVDFDPSPAVFTQTSAGSGDIFITTFDTTGSFICGTRLGGALDEHAYEIKHRSTDTFFVGGIYATNNMDFDPSPTSLLKANAGQSDAFIGKYATAYPVITMSPTMIGDTVCPGQSATLTLQFGAGFPGPYNVVINNGSGNQTYTNISSGVPFTLTPAPSSTTTYTLVAVSNPIPNCSSYTLSASVTATVLLASAPVVTAAANPASVCIGSSVILSGSGALNYSWSGGVSNGISFVPAASTLYTVTGANAAGCTNTATVQVIVNPLPVVTVSSFPSNAQVCTGNSMILNGVGAATYSWSGGINNGVAFTPTTSATYSVTGTDANGCSNTASISVIVNPLPTVNALATPSTICVGQTITFSGSGASSYAWPGGVNNGVPASLLSSASYTVTGTDANGCTNTSSVSITVNSLPNVGATAAPSLLCEGSSTLLSGSGANSYLWTGGVSNGVSFIPASSATYTVTGTDANGCTNTSTVAITVNSSLNISIIPNNPIVCLGDSIHLFASGASIYTWLPNSYMTQNNIADPFVFPVSNTTYTVTGTDASGCSGTQTISIQVVVDPKLILSKSGDIECNQHTIQLNASGAESYVWQPATGVSNANIANPIATLNQTTTFTVTATIGTCVITDTLSVYSYNNDETSIFIPNAFSPNNDGNNDCVHVRNVANFMNYYFGIYNRWGNLVFETDNPNDCWDGYFHNKPADVGTYYYYLKAETHCGKILKKGDITLLK
jgi:gliding motility-associated-like protein